MLSQTLSLVGLLAVAALLALVVQGAGRGAVPWARAAGVAVAAALCFWGAARTKGSER